MKDLPTPVAPCDCWECKRFGAPWESEDHKHYFRRESEGSYRTGDTRWRWTCECGARGRWQYQSPNVSYHQWIVHVNRRMN